ncbi:hypothetical protein M404DRAFT_803768 [Pisolithus tinctorius Marx 270]|uniref:Uncharacterized protein n=1 Tax=Pisolithus tinctorius Marx 270 TaxID=870435 RepID=A0A0C3JRX3_PISTI|nr:hypothetical protein M404DRAFT_803768 [Pisolithus tinctorius Marx 270]
MSLNSAETRVTLYRQPSYKNEAAKILGPTHSALSPDRSTQSPVGEIHCSKQDHHQGSQVASFSDIHISLIDTVSALPSSVTSGPRLTPSNELGNSGIRGLVVEHIYTMLRVPCFLRSTPWIHAFQIGGKLFLLPCTIRALGSSCKCRNLHRAVTTGR